MLIIVCLLSQVDALRKLTDGSGDSGSGEERGDGEEFRK